LDTPFILLFAFPLTSVYLSLLLEDSRGLCKLSQPLIPSSARDGRSHCPALDVLANLSVLYVHQRVLYLAVYQQLFSEPHNGRDIFAFQLIIVTSPFHWPSC
jgi:hypothetical protein